MVGDKATDVEAGKRAGVKSIFVLTGRGSSERNELKEKPVHIANDLLEAAKWVTSQRS
jgi:phosphoglycolate phosphatase-like HAD superfamily hydrolase